MRIDLHNHTNFSDGVYSPKQLIERAIKNKVDIFALTDHDSVFGCDEIVELAKQTNVKVIKGMELSTNYKGESIHIVVLFKDNVIPDVLLDFSKEHQEARRLRAINMMQNVHDIYGLNVDIESLVKDNIVITRANMMRNIAMSNGMTFNEAKKFVANDSLAYIPSTKMSVSDGLKLARQAKGFAILAHPCLIKEEILEDVLAFGFDGMEIRYPSPKNDEVKLKKLAIKYHLVPSAGSDCHGDSTHSDIGTCTLNEDEFKAIAKAINFKED